MVGCWMDFGWLEKAELKPTKPNWSWSWAELVNIQGLQRKEEFVITESTTSTQPQL